MPRKQIANITLGLTTTTIAKFRYSENDSGARAFMFFGNQSAVNFAKESISVGVQILAYPSETGEGDALALLEMRCEYQVGGLAQFEDQTNQENIGSVVAILLELLAASYHTSRGIWFVRTLGTWLGGEHQPRMVNVREYLSSYSIEDAEGKRISRIELNDEPNESDFDAT